MNEPAEKIKDVNTLYREMVEASPTCMLVVQANGILFANKAFEELTGYGRNDWQAMRPLDLIHPHDRSTSRNIGFDLLRKDTVADRYEIRWILKNCRPIWVEVRTRRIEHNGEQAVLANAVVINERKSAEAQQSLNEERYRLYFDNVSDVIFSVDSHFKIQSISPSVEKMLGYRSEEMVGKSFPDLGIIAPGSLHGATSYTRDILKGYEVAPPVFELTARDGSSRYAEITAAPLIKNGEIIAGIAIARDITERKRAEQALKESEERYRSSLGNSPNPIFSLDAEGKVRIWNQACENVFQYKKEEISGRSFNDLLWRKDDIREMDSMLVAVFAGETVSQKEIVYRCKDGTPLFTISRLFPLDVKNKQECLVANTDVTARKQAEGALRKAHDELEMRVRQRTAELEKANRALQWEILERKEAEEAAEAANTAKSRFLANMSHELRTPLNAIIGFTELIIDKKFGDLNPTQEEYLNDVLESSHHLLSLINDILDLSKVEAGKLDQHVSKFDLRELLLDSLVMVRERAMEHGIQLLTDINGIPEFVQADERQLKQVMYNLLSNAAKFTPDGGKIRLSAELIDSSGIKDRRIGQNAHHSAALFEYDRNWVIISVEDTGIGIDKNDMKSIFKPFYQVDSSTTRKYEGTGLGLSLTKKIVEMHGGSIWAESEGEGKGTRFNFLIPVLP